MKEMERCLNPQQQLIGVMLDLKIAYYHTD